jgi:integral membrane protein
MTYIFHFLQRVHMRYCEFRPFSDQEAWTLFRAAAIAEAVGWTALIIGVACSQLPVAWHDIPVAIAGRIHGTLFLAYIMAAVAFGPSLNWSLLRTLAAAVCSVPPYGSLVFEQWEARRRSTIRARRIYHTICYRLLLTNGSTI